MVDISVTSLQLVN